MNGGPYESSFSWDTFSEEWLALLEADTKRLQTALHRRSTEHPHWTEKALASEIHRETMQNFYQVIGGAEKFMNHSACFCCLREPPEHPLPCGHVLCRPCVQAYGRQQGQSTMELESCPLHAAQHFRPPWIIKIKPPTAGARILALDG